MRYPVLLTALAVACFTLGAVLPWVPLAPTEQTAEAAALTATRAVPPDTMLLAQEAKVKASGPDVEGVLALGDDLLHDARTCLTDRGVDVHPKVVRDADHLLEIIRSIGSRYAAVLIHMQSDTDLVDGDVQRVIASVGPATRVVWVTVRLEPADWGHFSPEDRINASISNVIRRAPQARLMDWRHAVEQHPDWADWMSEGMGVSSNGCKEYARKAVKLAGSPRGA